MQTIARANRTSEGKNNGLIVDYIETYKALLEALAIYGDGGGGKGGGETGGGDVPVRPKEELIRELEESLVVAEAFLQNDVHFNLQELIGASGLEKIAALERGINAIYTNDETKRKFQIIAREVFKKYKALQPDKVLYDYAPRKNALDALYTAIENKVESADVSEIMQRIQDIVDKSILNQTATPTEDAGKTIDLGGLNFELLEKYFLKTPNKNMAVQSLKDKIDKQLQLMVDRNPLRVDFYERYQKIIEEYNDGKDAVTIEETFTKLLEFVSSLTAEEAETKREGLTEEQKAVFDILRKPNLSASDTNTVKKIAIELLEELKKEELQVDLWFEKSQTDAAVFNAVQNTLFDKLPYPTYQDNDVQLKTALVYTHLRQQYYGGGRSVYGMY
jgi:type I restriction enzyme R subunit